MLRVSEQAFRTDTGRQRNANEDSFFVRAPVFVVADGMGGAQAGEVASKAAAEAFERDLPAAPPERVLRETIEAANREIHEHARADPSLAGMGTTITAAIVDPAGEEVAIGHVGDSRAYRLRDGRLERLTRDHSLVEEMRRKGQLTDAQAEDHPQRSIITRALGPEPEVEVDVQTVPAQPGDVFLLCSDGLTTMLDDEHIARILAAATSLEAAVRALIDEANRAGGRDNITALAFAPRGLAAASRQREPEGATLIGASARGGGADRHRGSPPRRRRGGARSGASSSPPSRSAGGCERAAKALAAVVLLGGDRLRRLVRQPPDLVPRHRRRRPGRALPRPSLRTPLRDRALSGALCEPAPDRLAAGAPPRRGHRPQPALALGRGLAARRNPETEGVP